MSETPMISEDAISVWRPNVLDVVRASHPDGLFEASVRGANQLIEEALQRDAVRRILAADLGGSDA